MSTLKIHETIACEEEEPKREESSLWLVHKSYLISFLVSVLSVLLGLFASFVINHFFPLGDNAIRWLQSFSAAPAFTALFGINKSWGLQAEGGRTAVEMLNQAYFKYLSFVSIFFPVVAFSLNPI